MEVIKTRQSNDDGWLVTAEQFADMSVYITVVVEKTGRKVLSGTIAPEDWKVVLPRIINILEEI